MRQINLRLPEELLSTVDELRGDISRTRWIRNAIELQVITLANRQAPLVKRRPVGSVVTGQPVRSSGRVKSGVVPVPKK